MRFQLAVASLLLFPAALCAQQAASSANASIVIDEFETVSAWSSAPADGVEVSVHQDNGLHGKALRIDFDFRGHGGYAVVKRAVELELPANYEFSFAIRGQAPNNTLEFKLVDPSGENVWWSNTVDYTFPREWTTYRRKKRQISFAWGPIGGGDMKRVASIELAITAGTGGKGSIWLDDLTLTPVEVDRPYDLTPRVTRTADSYDIDFLKRRELGALTVDWPPLQRAVDYDILGSTDGTLWQTLYRVRKTRATTWLSSTRSLARDYVWIPETDARYLRLHQVARSSGGPGSMSAVRDVSIKPLDWAPTKNDMLLRIAGDASRTGAPKGSYPKYLTNQQSYWTVIGADRDSAEGLINEEGMIEVGRGQFSVEPFLFDSGKLITWADAKTTVIAEPDALPLPRVKWSAPGVELLVSAFATGGAEPSTMFARYVVTNTSGSRRRVKLYLVVRPLQVNPPWQFLNLAGGAARVDSISIASGPARVVSVNGRRAIRPHPVPSGFVSARFADGNIVDGLRNGTIVNLPSVTDPFALASGAMEYNLDLAPGATSSPIDLEIPLHEMSSDPKPRIVTGAPVTRDRTAGSERYNSALTRTRAEWREKLGRVTIELPSSGQRHIETMRANLAYILINRDGAAIQPGSRSYSRSWIRDGSLTSTALLRLGHAQAVREFIEWYAPYQYDNGKIPCCVDEHGATPVPENDSHGQFIYLVAEYYRHTGDRALMEKMWPRVMKAVSYMDSLRQSRMTTEFQSGEKRIFYGLLPQSISHEGYSAKPMHSYWDDTFALRGFKDAAWMAEALNKPEAKPYRALEADFRKDFYASMELVMKTRNIDHLPASAELADFDATSTTTMITPGGEMHLLPQVALNRTFDKYFTQEFVPRANGTKKVDGYTPYELRAVGTFVQLGQKDRAHYALDWLFKDQRPPEWRMWSEGVNMDPKKPTFIGDMPHTWVGSDYIRSFLDMFAYERESDSTLVLAAGVKEDWATQGPGIKVTNLSTHYGPLSYTITTTGSAATFSLRQGTRIPPGGIVIKSPRTTPIRSARVNGAATPVKNSEVHIRSLPATVTLEYGN